jgi:hypothetical protein
MVKHLFECFHKKSQFCDDKKIVLARDYWQGQINLYNEMTLKPFNANCLTSSYPFPRFPSVTRATRLS